MPNWVKNEIQFTDEESYKQAVRDYYIADADATGGGKFDFQRLIPMPDNIYRGNLGPEEEAKYGKDNWYDWSIRNWETKWNSTDGFLDEENLTISFATAWSAPHPVIKAFAKRTRFDFTHRWADEDIGQNLGEREYSGGHLADEWDPPYGQDEAMEFAVRMWGLEGELIKVEGDWVYAEDLPSEEQ